MRHPPYASPSSPSQSATTSESELGRTMLDAALVLKTAHFAAEAVANILSTYGVTYLPTLMAAMLHDTVEDTDTTLEEIAREFGEEVANIVEASPTSSRLSGYQPKLTSPFHCCLQECTDPPNTPYLIRKQLQIDTAPRKSREAQQVKLADKMHNLRSIREDPPVGWTARRCQEYFIWARKVTSSCYPALPQIEMAFDDLYENQHFVMSGKIYKCHPDVGKDVVSEAEMVELKQFMSVQKKRKRNGAAPIYY
ncbi:hypothetical protein QFC22_001777 [Naganishia vaughanmartiniae]|uniref:Uncharacterized protein n=1 Tax=Naganishia vaughanmartiniae TaxID=1424756 RepID=A0ACC2XG41_9TREE|nr:hypothetical protein QFC22_001777 [Naganishia vaughanmartiniae]